MIISNNIQNPKMYLGNSNVLRIYQGLSLIYGQSTPVEPCFEVVNQISTASGEYVDVYELSTSKWYKMNNLNAYEEYGVMPTVQNLQDVTYYTGKLVVLDTDKHEYKWNGNAWSDLGAVGGIKKYTFFDGGESDEYEIPFDFYWGNGYKMEILCKRTSTVSGDKRVIGGEGTTPIIFSFYNNGFYFDRHNPKSTTSNECVSGTYSGRILNSSGLSNYLNDYLKIEIELDKVKFTCGDNTTTSGSTTYTTTWYDGLYRASIIAQKSNNYSICSIKIYNEQGNVIHDIEPKVNPDGQYLVTLYDSILEAEYNPTRATSTPAYHYEYSGTAIPVEDYQEKVAPADNVHYNTLAELELMECPWVGMRATIGQDNIPYKYTENGWVEVMEPCFEVVENISTASGEYVDVYEQSTGKWYKKNNLNTYEEYGVMQTVDSLQDTTYYTGKLVILSTDKHEYKWTGNEWSDLGNAGDIKTYTFLDGGESSEYKIPFDYHWGNGYKMEILCKRSSIVMGDLRVIDITSTSPIEFSFLNNGGFYLDRHNPTSTTSNACNTTDNDERIIAQSGVLNNYLNDYLKVEIELMKLKFTCGDRTATSGDTTYTASWYDGLYRGLLTAKKSNKISICNVKVYDNQGNVLHDIEPKVNPDGQYLVTLYDKILDAEYNPTQATSTPAYHYESSETVTPVEEYQEKVAPANNVHYNTLDELELMECPWIGMRATIGEDNILYKYTEDGWKIGYIIYGTTTGTKDMYVGSYGRNKYSSSSNSIHLHVKDGKFYAEESDAVGYIGAFYYYESGFNSTNNKIITSIDIWTYPNTNVTDMGSMFYECSGLTSVNLSQFNTSNVTSMNSMFKNCSSLTSLDLSNFNTAKVTDMGSMIRECTNLTYVNVSSFNTENVTNIGLMFYDLPKITSIDVSSFNTIKVESMSSIFGGCPNLTKITVSPRFFNSKKISTFDLSEASAWTDADSLETLVQALEANPRNRDIKLSDNTKNALTQSQKDRIKAALWSIY